MRDMTVGSPRGHLWRHALAPQLGITGFAYACAIGWTVMLLYEVPYYFITCRKQRLPR